MRGPSFELCCENSKDAVIACHTSFDWAEVQLLAKLGGWEPHTGRTPDKLTLQRGLALLLEMLATQAILWNDAADDQGLSPRSPLYCMAGDLQGLYEGMAVPSTLTL